MLNPTNLQVSARIHTALLYSVRNNTNTLRERAPKLRDIILGRRANIIVEGAGHASSRFEP